jgi:ubiquinone/menaquinone biosynthesis C-methylase UbiE
MSKSSKFFEEKIKKIAKLRIIYDIGGCSPFQKKLKPHKEKFINCVYKTVDIDLSCNPDILADIHDLPISSQSADGVLCLSVLEHVRDPFRVVAEVYRIIKPGGYALFHVPFIYPYHGLDYWRFSEDGVKCLFGEFSAIEICPVKGYFETIIGLLPYCNKFIISIFIYLARFLDTISDKHQSKKQTSGFFVFLKK